MSTSGKPSNQEVYADYAGLINRTASSLAVFDGRTFPHEFVVAQPDRGKYQVAEILPGKVVRWVPIEAVVKAITEFAADLPAKDFPFHVIDAGRAERAANHWMMQSPIFTDTIHPVLQKSQEGYCYHRLDFDAKDIPTPLFDGFLAHMRTNREAFLAWNGSLFDMKALRQTYLWLYGEGGDGKGVWCRFQRRLLAEAFVALNSETKHINQFFTARLVGKRLGIFQDCHSPAFVQSEMFMLLSGGDPVYVEEKGKMGYTTELLTMFMFSSNDLPDITGRKAHRRRAIICEMTPRTTYDGSKADYEDRFWAEREGILFKLLAAWKAMKSKHGEILADQEVVNEVVETSEEVMEHVFRDFFHHRDDAKEGMRPDEVIGILRVRARMNQSWEHRRFKEFLKRKGIEIKRENANAPRVYRGLFPKENF